MEATILKEYGLTTNEITIFTTLIEHGQLSASNIASKTGLNRPYVYYALERLLEKGFLSEVKIKNKRIYQHIQLNDILSNEEVKLQALKKELKDLETKRKPEELSVEVIKGTHVIKNIVRKYKEFSKPGDEILSVGIQEEIMEGTEPIYVKQAVNYNIENDISERIITTPGAKQLDYASTTKYRFLNKKYLNSTAKIIFGEYVVELFYQKPTYAIIIHNKSYAKTARNQFELLWKSARK